MSVAANCAQACASGDIERAADIGADPRPGYPGKTRADSASDAASASADEHLLKAISRGDRGAFADLVTRHLELEKKRKQKRKEAEIQKRRAQYEEEQKKLRETKEKLRKEFAQKDAEKAKKSDSGSSSTATASESSSTAAASTSGSSKDKSSEKSSDKISFAEASYFLPDDDDGLSNEDLLDIVSEAKYDEGIDPDLLDNLR